MTATTAISTLPPLDLELPSFSLLGRTAFVSGGSRGIGRACALALASAGADVAVGSSPAGAELAGGGCRQIPALGRRAEAYSFDVTLRGDLETMCDRVSDDFESVDILVNNAGITRD